MVNLVCKAGRAASKRSADIIVVLVPRHLRRPRKLTKRAVEPPPDNISNVLAECGVSVHPRGSFAQVIAKVYTKAQGRWGPKREQIAFDPRLNLV